MLYLRYSPRSFILITHLLLLTHFDIFKTCEVLVSYGIILRFQAAVACHIVCFYIEIRPWSALCQISTEILVMLPFLLLPSHPNVLNYLMWCRAGVCYIAPLNIENALLEHCTSWLYRISFYLFTFCSSTTILIILEHVIQLNYRV